MTRHVLVLNGANLNLLGSREPDIYGSVTLDEVMERLAAHVADRDVELRHVQSNSEGGLIDALQGGRGWADGVVCNAGAYTHTSYALRDAIAGCGIPTVETHVSNVHAREEFRHDTVLGAVCIGVVSGFGSDSYLLAIDGLLAHLDARS